MGTLGAPEMGRVDFVYVPSALVADVLNSSSAATGRSSAEVHRSATLPRYSPPPLEISSSNFILF